MGVSGNLKRKNMSRFSEQTFDGWRRPASETEEQRISNTISMIKDAIKESDELKNKDIDIFVQGSYANNTNVRANSDVDVCIMLKDNFYSEYPEGLTRECYGFMKGTNDYSIFRKQVIRALINKYGDDNVIQGNKSIKIKSTSYRVEADAVPSFQYRNYKYIDSKDPEKYIEGIKFFAQSGEEIINYPKVHIENGKEKNAQTQRRYKRLVRIFKRIRYKMIDDKEPVNSGITSFLIECLLWNIPNSIYNSYDTWTERIKQAIKYLYANTDDENKCQDWGEVSEMLYLFHSERKWDYKMVNDFMTQLWKYLEF